MGSKNALIFVPHFCERRSTMTIRECYDMMEADYNSIYERFGGEELVGRFAVKFLKDNTYDRLCDAVASGDWMLSFRLVHTLKGIAANLSFTRLETATDAMTEALRGGKELINEDLFEEVKASYTETVRCLLEYTKA